MIAALNKIPQDLRDISTLIIGNGFALFVPVLVSPIISRLYDADDFGAFTVYLAIVSLFSAVATGRLDYAILISKSRNNAQHLYKISTVLAFAVALIVLVAVSIWKEEILNAFSVAQMGNYIYLIPLNIFLFALIHVNQNGLNKEQSYGTISAGKTIRSILVGGVQVLLGFMGFLSGGLIIGKIVGDFFSSAYLSSKISRIDNYFRSAFSLKRSGYLIKKYEKFLLINTPHAFVNTLSVSVTAFILGLYFSDEIIGYYGLSFMVCIAPVQLIGNAFYQVFSQRISVMHNNKEGIKDYTKRTLAQLFVLSVIPFSLLALFGPDIFQFVFGEKWLISGEFVQLLSPFLFLVFLIAPLNYIPLIYNEHKKSFFFEMALFISRVIALIAGAEYGSAYLSILFFSIVSVVVQALNLFWIVHLTKKFN